MKILFGNIANEHEIVISIEEGSIGGFGSHVAQFLNEKNLLDSNLKYRSMFLPDRFIDHDKPELMYKYAGLDALNIENKVLDTLNSKVIVKKVINYYIEHCLKDNDLTIHSASWLHRLVQL